MKSGQTMVAAAALACSLSGPILRPAEAHAVWSDGRPVPEWVRDACCGPADVHHLSPSAVHRDSSGFRIDGIQEVVPFSKTLESEDGEYWIFYRNFDDGTQYVFCFFAPSIGS